MRRAGPGDRKKLKRAWCPQSQMAMFTKARVSHAAARPSQRRTGGQPGLGHVEVLGDVRRSFDDSFSGVSVIDV